MIQTAVEHADAARRAEKEFGPKTTATTPAVKADIAGATPVSQPVASVVAPPSAKQGPTKNKATIEKAPDPGSLQAVSILKDAQTEMPQRTVVQAKTAQATIGQEKGVTSKIAEAEIAETVLEETATPVQIAPSAFGKVRNCQSCGFPISEGRRLCLDCEAATPNLEPGNQDLQTVALLESSPGWLRSNLYLVGAAVLVVATIAIVVWRF
jgi:hypothetical protein